MPRARDSTNLQHHFCQFVFFIYVGNNITKFDHLSLNIRQNNRYYRFGSYILNISSKFVEFFRNNRFCKINTRNFHENGRTVIELTRRQMIKFYNSLMNY